MEPDNYHVPQKNIGHITPIQALKDWHKKRPYSLQAANPPKTTDNHWLSVKKYCKLINVKITRVILCRNLRFEVNPRGLNRKFLFKCPR